MGCGAWSSRDWDAYKTKKKVDRATSVHEIYTSSSIKESMNPKGLKMRESRDSSEHPNSNPIIIGLDVTGSMGDLSTQIAKESLNTLITDVYKNNSLPDPQICFAAIGDTYYDDSPFQVTQFESDIRIAEQLTDTYFEGGGGPNSGESYLLAWYFASRHTSCDAIEKRGKKGIIFTMGDEPDLPFIPKDHIKNVFGDDVQKDIDEEELFNETSKNWEIFHIITEHGSRDFERTEKTWRNLLGQRALKVTDITKIPQVIESTLEMLMGKSVDEVVSKYDTSTALVVRNAINGLSEVGKNTDLVEF